MNGTQGKHCSSGEQKAPLRCVRGKTHRSGEPVGDGGGPHEAFTMEGTDVRALWFTYEPAGIWGKFRPAGDRGQPRYSRVS